MSDNLANSIFWLEVITKKDMIKKNKDQIEEQKVFSGTVKSLLILMLFCFFLAVAPLKMRIQRQKMNPKILN